MKNIEKQIDEKQVNILELLKNEKVEWKKLEEVAKNSFWLMPATPKYQDAGIPYITSKNIINGKISFQDVKYISNGDFEKISQNREVLKGDILITMIGKIGEIAIVEGKEKFYGQNMYLIRLDEKKILNKFYCYYFTSFEAQKKLISAKNNSTQGYIKAGAINNLEIPVPSLEIQEKIVKILDKFTKYVTELQAELQARTKQYNYYRDMLLSEDYLTKITEKINSEKEYPIRLTTLGEIGKFTRGNGLQKKDFREKGKPVIHYGEIYTKYNFSADKTYSFAENEIYSKLRKAKQNDILMATTSENIEDVGKSVVWLGNEEIGFSGDMYSYSTEENSKYIAYYFQTANFQRQKERKVTGTKLIRIHVDDMEKFEIPLPPLEIQNKVVLVLDKFQKLLNETNGLLPEEIEQRRKQYEFYREKLLTFEIECDRTNERTNERTIIL